MPHRLVSLAILIFWAIAASALFIRDLLPDLIVGPPPDLRDLAHADTSPRVTRWAIQVADDRNGGGSLRAVGMAETETVRKQDGWVRLDSHVWFDSGNLLRGTPLEVERGERIEVRSVIEIEDGGNLHYFRSGVKVSGERAETMVLEGMLRNDAIEVVARGPFPLWNWKRRFPYKARGVVQNTMGPMDRMPGLRLGQRWESQVVSPLTGQVETVRVQVARRDVMIHWDKGLVSTYEVETRMPGMTSKTWVRSSDGLVLRQEVPLLFVKLVLDRQPDSDQPSVSSPRP